MRGRQLATTDQKQASCSLALTVLLRPLFYCTPALCETMSSILISNLAKKRFASSIGTSPAVYRLAFSPVVSSIQNQIQLRNYYDGSSEQQEDIVPVYIHRVSKVVLQHLQGSRSGWLVDQGLTRGLQIKSNGTFLLKFPARKGFDGGKIWYVYVGEFFPL